LNAQFAARNPASGLRLLVDRRCAGALERRARSNWGAIAAQFIVPPARAALKWPELAPIFID
jgi:hypothetical protein